jgi:hypothetical protein
MPTPNGAPETSMRNWPQWQEPVRVDIHCMVSTCGALNFGGVMSWDAPTRTE